MKTYRNEFHRFEIQIPDEWSLHSEGKEGPNEYSFIFRCRPCEAFNIQLGPLNGEPSLEETESSLRAYSEKQGYTCLNFGQIQATGKEHLWARYYIGGGIWAKKYMLVLGHVEYAVTASCLEQKYLLDMEQDWDIAVSSFLASPSPASSLRVEKILQILAQPAVSTEMPRRIELCKQALALTDRCLDPETWAGLQIELAKNLAQNPFGDRVQKIEQAIIHNQSALEVFTRENYPEYWANIQVNLGSNYRNRLWGNRAENIEEAIRYCLGALEVLNILQSPLLWANAHNNLANSYRDRLQGDHGDNIEQCIKHCDQALLVFTRRTLPVQWATVQNNLGNAYQDRLLGDPGSNIEKALECYQQAEQVFTRVSHAEDWAWTQGNLGGVYHQRVRGDPDQNIQLSIQHSNQALVVFKQATHPEKWALAHLHLGHAYDLCQSGEHTDHLERSLEHYHQALTVFTQKDYPQYWERIQLGIVAVNQQLMPMKTHSIAFETAAPVTMEVSPKITFLDQYRAALRQKEEEKCHLKLIYADVPDIKYATSMLLVYQWEEELSFEEADKLRLRTAAYLTYAIYDVACYTDVPCEPSPIRTSQRPAWMVAGEASPIYVTLSEFDLSEKTLQLSIGPMVVSMNSLPINKDLLRRLMQGFQEKFADITV